MPLRPEKHASATPDQLLLVEVGQALYGDFFQRRAAEQIGIAPPVLNQMKNGTKKVSPRVWHGLAEQLQAQVQALGDMLPSWAADARTRKHAFLVDVGLALYGEYWQRSMAAELEAIDASLFLSEDRSDPRRGVGKAAGFRKLNRWSLGDQPIPDALWDAVERLVRQRRQALIKLQPKLARRIEEMAKG